MTAVLGIDIGGSGSRIALKQFLEGPGTRPEQVDSTDRFELQGPRVQVSSTGSSVSDLTTHLLETAAENWPDLWRDVVAVGVGATGVASLVTDPAALATHLGGEVGKPVALATDAVTAHLGALGGEGGAVSVLGTGAIAVGHPGPDVEGVFTPQWRRVDGWGHLLGDRGGGAWVGRQGLTMALRAHDGVESASGSEALLAAAIRRFGSPEVWPGQFYTRDDRAGLLAEFARDIVDLAGNGEPASVKLLTEAGREAARSGLASLAQDCPPLLVLSGGLARASAVLRAGFRAEVAEDGRGVSVRDSAGDPLDGALALGQQASSGKIQPQEGMIWVWTPVRHCSPTPVAPQRF
ncbi:MAG TPA: hypothetical protein H9870_09495 [Candidatus Corynebacterium avicola]|uniref:ATPase BadF/BadG/BcrA/BcrD type domain-containing protein n=1 Tax=Candidatus Corynebacterium avicola TaxID=2838527 RepID=A0A9D1RPQ0_9CORY|nr:hypothetical protein [Candidatus Corynebacterium avicola]